MVRLRGLDVQVKLVGDIKRGPGAEETAKVVRARKSERTARVEVKTEVETYQGGGKTDAQAVLRTPASHGQPVAAGGGVLGFLMAEKGTGAAPALGPGDPKATQLEDLNKYKGHRLNVTVYDPEAYDSLQSANRRGDSMDFSGVLVEASPEKLVLKRDDGRITETDPEMWCVASVEVERGDYSWKKDPTMTIEGVGESLLPGAPIELVIAGQREPTPGTFVGTTNTKQGLLLDYLDAAGNAQQQKGADLYDVRSPGYSFSALERD